MQKNEVGESTRTEMVTTKEVDYLDEDKKIRGQNYALLSFVSPEDVILNKEVYVFSRYLNQFSKDMKTLFDGIMAKYPDTTELVEALKGNHSYIFDTNELAEQYKFFKSVNSAEVEADYHRDNNFQTTIRGIKVRGVFDTLDEAKNRSEFLKKVDSKFDIYIGEVGCWCPWSPNPSDLENQEFSETQLNTLMKKYKENMESKDTVFEQRKQDSIAKSTARSATTTDVADISQELERADPWTERKEAEAKTEADAKAEEDAKTEAEAKAEGEAENEIVN